MSNKQIRRDKEKRECDRTRHEWILFKPASIEINRSSTITAARSILIFQYLQTCNMVFLPVLLLILIVALKIFSLLCSMRQ